MNPDKARAAQRRWSFRRDEKKRGAKKKALLTQISMDPAALETSLDELPVKDAFDLIGGSVKSVRRVVSKIQRRLPATATGGRPKPPERLVKLERPSWNLRERNRTTVRPNTIPRERSPDTIWPRTRIVAQLEEFQANGKPVAQVLDWVQQASRLKWEECAHWVAKYGYKISLNQIKETRLARRFWERFARFNDIYENAVRLGQIERAPGEWAYVSEAEIADWLPGLRIPKMQRRDDYLVRLVHDDGQSVVALDFYSVHYLPLFVVAIPPGES